MTITFRSDYMFEKRLKTEETDARRTLRALAGVRLSAREAREAMPSIQKHKWYLSERMGRDVGLKVAAIDYFENIHRPSAAGGTLTQRLVETAEELGTLYLAHQSWKAHDGLFLPRP